MVNSRHYQAFIGGVVVAFALLFLASQFWHWNSDSGMAIFDGELPSVPEYGPKDEVKELHYTDNKKTPEELDKAPLNYAIGKTSNAPVMPSMTRIASWDTAWDDRRKWPGWSTPTPTPTSSSIPSLSTGNISKADVKEPIP